MILDIKSLIHVLALSDSSGAGDFFRQVGGLLVLTCGAGVVWLALMALVMQRASERRRRAAQGLEPLPGIHIALYRWLTNLVSPGATREPPPDPQTMTRRSQPAPAPVLPTPDLDMLTGNLPTPDLEATTGHEQAESPPEGEEMPSAEYAPPEPSPEPAEDIATADASEETPDTPDAAQEPDHPPPAPAAPPQDSIELLRVYRDLADGMLIVEIGGKQFRSLGDLRGADLERRFQNVVRDLDALARPAQRSKPVAPSPETPAAPDEEDIKPRSGSMLRQVTRMAMGQSPEPVEEELPRSIADEIEDLLQDRLKQLPAYAGRKIHVKPALDGSVQIEVDGIFYDGVGDIADDDVRELLIDTVREWEESR